MDDTRSGRVERRTRRQVMTGKRDEEGEGLSRGHGYMDARGLLCRNGCVVSPRFRNRIGTHRCWIRSQFRSWPTMATVQCSHDTRTVLLISTITTSSQKFTSILSLEVIHHVARAPQSTCRTSPSHVPNEHPKLSVIVKLDFKLWQMTNCEATVAPCTATAITRSCFDDRVFRVSLVKTRLGQVTCRLAELAWYRGLKPQ
jgi:hypothetical protein